MSEPIWNDPRITAYTLGELDADEREQFESELASSPELTDAVNEARGLTEKLEHFYASESLPTLDADRHNEILGGAAKSQPASPTHKRISPLLKFALAASLLFVIGALAIPAVNQSKVREMAKSEVRQFSVEFDKAEDFAASVEEASASAEGASSGRYSRSSSSLRRIKEKAAKPIQESAMQGSARSKAILSKNPVGNKSANDKSAPYRLPPSPTPLPSSPPVYPSGLEPASEQFDMEIAETPVDRFAAPAPKSAEKKS